MSIFEYINKYLGCCLNCGSLICDSGCLCLICRKSLEHLRSKEAFVKLGSLKLKTLYEWEAGRSDMLSGLILWLKGPRQKIAWRHYASAMAKNYACSIPSGNKVIIVFAPSKTGRADHAFLWAESLSFYLGAELLPCLKKSSTASQRGAGRGQRSLIEFEIDEKSTEQITLSGPITWIFADDVVTTGATARAAHKALGNPKDFEIWALAHRTLPCEPP